MLHEPVSQYVYYEPQYFQFSTTYRSWVKLFVEDCYRLRSLEGFESTGARFWKNHPVRWIQLVGIVFGVTIKSKFTEIEIDDGSGKCLNLYCKGSVLDIIKADFISNSCSIDVGDLIKVKGELATNFRGDLHLVVSKVEKLKDATLELSAWQERIKYKKTVLEVPWTVPQELLTTSAMSAVKKDSITVFENEDIKTVSRTFRANRRAQAKEEDKKHLQIDLPSMETSQHIQRNLKRVFLQHFECKNVREFSVHELRAMPDLEEAVFCVTRHSLHTQMQVAGMDDDDLEASVITSAQKYRTINTCLGALVLDGSIIPVNAARGTYSVVGSWNLGALMQEIMQEQLKQKCDQVDITVREMWQAVRQAGRGFESVSKQMVQRILSQMK